jgi:hypothetical protein
MLNTNSLALRLGTEGVEMGKRSKVRESLRQAMKRNSICRIARGDSMDHIDGFVVGLGKKWVLIARTMDGGYPDGLIAIRLRDVSKISKNRSFETKFASKQSQPEPAVLARIDLDRTSEVIASMSSLAVLVAVERSRVRAHAIWIGKYAGENGKWFGLLHIGTDATWDKKPIGYRIKDVTSVSIDSHYLTALASIAPKAPRSRSGAASAGE